MKSLAKIVAMGLVMSSVPVMGVWAENLVVTERSQWDWVDPGYTYNAYSPIHHKNNDYEDVTIFMNGNEQKDTDNKNKPFNALINEYAQYHFYILKIAVLLLRAQMRYILILAMTSILILTSVVQKK